MKRTGPRRRARDLSREEIEQIRLFHREHAHDWLATCREFGLRPSVIEQALRYKFEWERPANIWELTEEERAIRENLRGWLIAAQNRFGVTNSGIGCTHPKARRRCYAAFCARS